jgi:hypothetical protein
MRRVNTILSLSGLVLALSLPSWAQEVKQLPTQTVTISGTVATIDHAKRVVNIKTSDGKFETVDVPAGAKRFDELKVGDKVSLTYNNNVSARLKPPGEAAVDTGSSTTTAGQQARPGGTATVQRTMTVIVDTIDKSASSMTFSGPNGWKYSRHIVDPTVFDKVKVGDKIDITWNTDVTVAVQ